MTEDPFVPAFEGITFDSKWYVNGTSDTLEGIGKERWTDITVYGLAPDGYVVCRIGQTDIKGEIPLPWMAYASTAQALVQSLLRPGRRPGSKHLPDYAKAALSEAATHDAAVAAALAAWENAAQWAR